MHIWPGALHYHMCMRHCSAALLWHAAAVDMVSEQAMGFLRAWRGLDSMAVLLYISLVAECISPPPPLKQVGCR